jgi:hypothetical protein
MAQNNMDSSPDDKVQRVLDEILERLDLLEARIDAIHGATGRPDEVSSSAAERRNAEIRRRPR